MRARGQKSDVTTTLAAIASADRDALLSRWHHVHGTPPPKSLSVGFLRKALSYEAQVAARGGPKPQVLRDLKRLANSDAAASPKAGLAPGTQLVREWNGRTYRVTVSEAGFVMDGQMWTSLSTLARHITGAHWSGPRFFGLGKGTRQTPAKTEMPRSGSVQR
ncbi:DUF2924 domain-containing protein [Cognatiyoonia sp. IB215182]|uniref:DUF2924 domain-containing protein n=1 Tax=Cognatiyoonia sp. IB215182 TaxID=3097353 RepID=UPI002A0DD7A8|nr:DUF2924 domain-containing protein [Cognatiyoonia sp. IB215182]MDX8355541.1 DUF2924 domain-containing protein [Cognatiyoonia sp. IB215182]